MITLTDSYKITHWKQYPPGTKHVYSYFESRGCGDYSYFTFFGLQYILQKYFQGKIVTRKAIYEAEQFSREHFGDKTLFNKAGWDHIRRKHKGRLPIKIWAVLEGSHFLPHQPVITVMNTDPAVPWLTNYVETLLVQIWAPIIVASYSKKIKNTIIQFLKETGNDSPEFKLHDFGLRGSSSVESAAILGAAHLVNFKGTDNIPAIYLLKEYYDAGMPGFSIPASEHSTITSWGRENESLAYENMLNSYPSGLVACVSDSYHIYDACKNIWGKTLLQKVLDRNGTLVIRPDSGDPREVIIKLLDILGNAFGSFINNKGYKVLTPKVRLIQGDGIDYKTLSDILNRMKEKAWSADNISFGSGGALLQKHDRDEGKFAFKCSAIKVEEKWRDVSKSPITDPNKASKAGRFSPSRYNLHPVFEDGKLLYTHNLLDIRERSNL